MATVPERIGKYLVMDRLASGASAEIYKVKTVGIAGFEKIQVVKRFSPRLAQDPRFVRAFVQEARLAMSLNHRNIVQVFEYGRVDEDLFLAMELIEGVSLREALVRARERDGAPPPAISCYVLSEVAAAIDYAHRKQDAEGRLATMAHGDVSPDNIELSHEGYVKVLNFGVPAALAIGAGVPHGDPAYRDPEATAGSAPSARGDVFALARIAWQVLGGVPPETPFDPAHLRRALGAGPGSDALAGTLDAALAPGAPSRGTAADLGTALLKAQRGLDPGVGSRSLARWVAGLLSSGREPVPDAGDLTRPVKTEARPEPAGRAAARIGVTAARTDVTAAPAGEPATLGEKRPVVAAVCRLDGGRPERRREICESLAGIAYKHRAVLHRQPEEPGSAPGDWLTVLFGLEVASEDDAADAMRFALDVVDAVRQTSRPDEGAAEQVTVRIGARHGIVAPRASGEGYLLLGDTLDEARALALAAAPGRALLGGAAGRLAAAHYAFRELAPLRLRARRVRVLELLGARAADPRGALSGAIVGRFHGRTAELGALLAAYDEARGGDRRVVCAVVGEAGVGKTRLVAELVERAAASSPRVVIAAARPGGRDAPYALAIDLLRASLGLAPGLGTGGRARLLDRLRGELAQRAVPADVRDDALSTVELALALREGAAAATDEVSANLRDRMVAALSTLREGTDSSRPRLTIIEDLHWADGASAEVARMALVPPAPPGAELVVLTTRPEEDAPPLPGWVAPIVTLAEMTAEERTVLARERLGDGASDALVGQVLRRAGGNPLFIEELASAVHDLGPGELPETGRAVIMARVDRLPSSAKAILQHAAVVGMVFRARLLEDLLGRGVNRALRLLADRGIITRASREALESDDGELTFRNGLIQEVVYDSLSGSARRDAHRRIGLKCAERHEAGRTESPAAIARHLELGGEERLAARFALRAGRLALAAYDARGAVSAFTRALALGGSEGRDREREALSGREQAYSHLGDHAAQLADLRALERLCADDPRRLADVLNHAASRHLRLGEYADALVATERAERAAETGGDERTRGEALRIRAEIFDRQADFERALIAVTRALEIFRRIGARTEETRALIGIGRTHLLCNRFEDALGHYEPALERVRQSGDLWLERIIRNNVAIVHLNRGEFTAAFEHAMRAVDISRRFGDRAREGDNMSVAGTILLELGRYDEARRWMEGGLAIHAETGSRWSRADALVYAAHCETLSGNLDRAFRLLDESIRIAAEIGARYIVANAKNQLAYALLRRRGPGDLAAAQRAATEAAEIGREAALVACEIQGLSRSALARLEAGDAASALAPSAQAVEKLETAVHVEWSEEEIWFTHHRILSVVGDPRAHDFLERAHAGLDAKMALIADAEWRRGFRHDVELHRLIDAAWAARSSRR